MKGCARGSCGRIEDFRLVSNCEQKWKHYPSVGDSNKKKKRGVGCAFINLLLAVNPPTSRARKPFRPEQLLLFFGRVRVEADLELVLTLPCLSHGDFKTTYCAAQFAATVMSGK